MASYIYGISDERGRHVWPSLATLAERHGVRTRSVERRASVQKWCLERRRFLGEVRRRREEKSGAKLRSMAADFDLMALRCARLGMARIAEHLARSDLRAIDLMWLSLAMATYQRIGRLAILSVRQREHASVRGFDR